MYSESDTETFPEDLRKKVVARFPRVYFKEEIAKAFLGGFESKTQSTEGTCNEVFARTSSATTSGAIFTSRSRFELRRIIRDWRNI